jgi:hypothetical protein
MKKKMVSYTLETLPPLTAKQRANLRALAARPDSEIDTSDVRELTAEQWKNATRGRLSRRAQGKQGSPAADRKSKAVRDRRHRLASMRPRSIDRG